MTVGLNKFILVYVINDLSDYSKNRYEIVNPETVSGKISREIASIAVRPTWDKCGNYHNKISDYYYLVLDKDCNFNLVNDLFKPTNQQFLILLNHSIPYDCTSKIVQERILKYINTRTPEFLIANKFGLAVNTRYTNFKYQPLPGQETEYKIGKCNIFEFDLIKQ